MHELYEAILPFLEDITQLPLISGVTIARKVFSKIRKRIQERREDDEKKD